MDRLLTPDEVTGLLSVPVATLYRWRYVGTGPPAIRVGKHLRHRRQSLEAYVAGLEEYEATAK